MFTIDDFVKVVLVLSVCFALVGISIQIIRLMGGFIDTVKLANDIMKNVTTIVDKFTGDYDYIMEQIKFIIDTVSKFVNGVVGPVTKLAGFMQAFAGKMPGQSKKKKPSKSNNDENSDDEETVDDEA